MTQSIMTQSGTEHDTINHEIWNRNMTQSIMNLNRTHNQSGTEHDTINHES